MAKTQPVDTRWGHPMCSSWPGILGAACMLKPVPVEQASQAELERQESARGRRVASTA